MFPFSLSVITQIPCGLSIRIIAQRKVKVVTLFSSTSAEESSRKTLAIDEKL